MNKVIFFNVQYIVNYSNRFSGVSKQPLPASKSISNRILIMNALANGGGLVSNLAKCDDTDVLVAALSSDGTVFDIGAAGTAMRFLSAYLANKEGEWVTTGSARMKERPIRILVDALNSVGADVSYLENDGFPPLRISGKPLDGGVIELDGGVSSQYISALLMIAPVMKNGLVLRLTGNVISKPYIKMTLSLMRQFGIASSWNGNEIKVERQDYKPIDFTVESDWSASSYWFQICALAEGSAEILLPGLFCDSVQGDSAVVNIFENLGVSSVFEKDGLLLKRDRKVAEFFEYDFVEQPDLAQTVVAACCALGVTFNFEGLQSLKIKETDRIAALIAELRKFGYVLFEPKEGALAWNGERCEADAKPVVKTYKDHRMAMAFAPLAVKFGEVCIDDPAVVSKSYPEYWTHLRNFGFDLAEV